ncbi:MAG: transporter substrate-binding domain-containing protein, partial [Candidatus Theseobacter exili]|nr:transporter substrate-binding domain-containing protein [Candidatus Theseobacter exili]
MQKANNFLSTIIAFVILISPSVTDASAQNKQDPGSTQNITIELTKEEKIFLKSHPVIRFGTDGTWAPYVVKGANGILEGFDVDLIKYINERVGTNIQIVTGRWAEIVEQAKDLKLDGLATFAASKERGLLFNFSKSYISLFPIFVVDGNSKLKIDGIDDFSGKSIAILKGHQFYLNLLGKYPSINVIESPSEIDAISLTIEGNADAAIVATTSYNNYYKTFGKDIKIGYVATDNPLDIVYSIRKDWPELTAIINKALVALPQETKNNLFSRWFGFSSAEFGLGNEEKRVTLTAQEQAWIKAHPEITLGGGISFEPFIMYDNDGKVI